MAPSESPVLSGILERPDVQDLRSIELWLLQQCPLGDGAMWKCSWLSREDGGDLVVSVDPVPTQGASLGVGIENHPGLRGNVRGIGGIPQTILDALAPYGIKSTGKIVSTEFSKSVWEFGLEEPAV